MLPRTVPGCYSLGSDGADSAAGDISCCPREHGYGRVTNHRVAVGRKGDSGKRMSIMNKARRIVVAGLGAMTPAFVVTDQVQARPAESAAVAPAQTGIRTIALDQEALKSALLGLSSAEKLRIAGDRIRLAKSNVQSTSKGAAAGKQTASATCTQRTTYATATCGGARRAR